jgi:hypothetical protein
MGNFLSAFRGKEIGVDNKERNNFVIRVDRFKKWMILNAKILTSKPPKDPAFQ